MKKIFGRQAPIILEIGFGMGDATREIAINFPNYDFIGIEVFDAGVGSLLQKIENEKITNLRIIWHDAIEVIRDMIPINSLMGVHIFFPDPWPKNRHHKRRLIQIPFINLLSNRIVRGGYIHCATDWENYAEQMIKILNKDPLLLYLLSGCNIGPNYRPVTKFEKRGLQLGHNIWDIIFNRVI